jgi:hypothetical protein
MKGARRAFSYHPGNFERLLADVEAINKRYNAVFDAALRRARAGLASEGE